MANLIVLDKMFQTLAQRETNQRIRAEYERQVKIREEKEELKRNQINKFLEQKITERYNSLRNKI